MGEPRVHALLIGIDAYVDGPPPLFGCVHDIDEIQRLLTDSLGVPRTQVTRLVASHDETMDFSGVVGRLATRENIVDALRAFGGEMVGPADRVFIYYSGHGDSVTVRDARGQTLREALVPADVLIEATREVFNLILDVELIALLRGISARTQQVTMIVDACHSGGATRASFRGEVGDRSRHAGMRGVMTREVEGERGVVRGVAGSLEACVVAAACQADEPATEGSRGGGRAGGLFTAALVEALAGMTGEALVELRWGQIWREVVARVEAGANQHPQLLGSMARKVFGGPPEEGDPGFDVFKNGEGQRYRLAVGELAGVTRDALVGVYAGVQGVLPRVGTEAEREARLGLLKVVETRRGSCEAELVEGRSEELMRGVRGQVVAPGAAMLTVAFDPPGALTEPLRAALAGSAFVRVVTDEPAGLVLKRCGDGALALTDALHGTGEDGEAWLFRVAAGAEAGGVVAVIEHYIKYMAPVEFARRCNDPPANLLRLEVLDCTRLQFDEDGNIVDVGFDPQAPLLPVVPANAAGQREVVAGVTLYNFEVSNPGKRTLHVTVIESGASGRVRVLGAAVVKGGGRHVFWAEETPGNPFCVGLPEDKAVILDRVVAIGTSVAGTDLRYLAARHSFAEVLAGEGSKGGVGKAAPAELWTADVVVLRCRAG